MDDFSGDNYDPPSLHKYLYAHANPINNLDPSGKFSLTEMLTVATIMGTVCGLTAGVETAVRGGTVRQVIDVSSRWFLIGFGAGAAVYGGVWAIYSLWIYLAGGGAITAQQAAQNGYESHSQLVRAWRGLGANGEIHHFVQQHSYNIAQFGRRAIYSKANSIPIPNHLHKLITTYTNSSTKTLQLVDKYGYYSHLHEYIRALSWEAQYRWGVEMYTYVVENSTMQGFNPVNLGR